MTGNFAPLRGLSYYNGNELMEMTMTNEDQVKGKAKDIGGKAKEEAGDVVGNDKLKRDGQEDQAEGKVQKGVGDAKEKLSD